MLQKNEWPSITSSFKGNASKSKNLDSLKALDEEDLGKVAGGRMELIKERCDFCEKETSTIYYDDETDLVACEACYKKRRNKYE